MTMKFACLSDSPSYFRWNYMHVPSRFNIDTYLREKLEVHDCDSGGDDTSFWVVQTPDSVKFYRCYHDYGWANYGEDDQHVYNDFIIGEISKDEMLAEDTYGYIKSNLIYVV